MRMDVFSIPKPVFVVALAFSLVLFSVIAGGNFSPVPSIALAQNAPNANSKQEIDVVDKDSKSENVQIRNTLDDLFGRLKRETDAGKAQRIERIIWQRWSNSGSETIDLLMSWAAAAVKEKNWGTAFDLLDQVIVLAPQYAEGWNRRATLYFQRSDYGRSLHDIEQVLKLEARHFGAMAGLGSILQRLKQDQRALEIWERLLTFYPANKNAQKSVEKLKEKLAGTEI